MVFPAEIQLAIYNSTGEVVRRLDPPGPYEGEGSLKVPSGIFDPIAGAPLVMQVWGHDLAWDGDNDGGQPVSNGVYYVKLTYRDSTYTTKVFSSPITVQHNGITFSLKIYNTAGEVVRSLAEARPYDPPEPGPLSIPDPSLLIGPDGKAVKNMVFDLGNMTMEWDGRDNQGRSVQSGKYLVEMVVYGLGTGPGTYDGSVTVMNQAQVKGLQGTVLLPNPVALSRDRQVQVLLPNGTWDQAWAGMYTLAGGLVAPFEWRPGEGALTLDLNRFHPAPGIYLIEIRAVNRDGMAWTRAMKVAVSW
jgi:hypothetical protein